MIRAVILDFDDTLCLAERYCFKLENEVLRRLGRSPQSREVHKRTWGQHMYEAMEERSPGIDVVAFHALFPTVLAEFVAAGKLDVIPAENYAALDRLIADRKQIMILTGRSEAELIHLLAKNHPLAARIVAFYHHNNTEYHKPDPRVFAELLKDYDLQPAECVYVGDSVGDAQAATGAGMGSIISLESGLRSEDDFAAFPNVVFINTLPEVYATVKSVDK